MCAGVMGLGGGGCSARVVFGDMRVGLERVFVLGFVVLGGRCVSVW